MSHLVGVWRVEQEGATFAVYSGEERLSEHPTLDAAESWMCGRYWAQMAALKEDEPDAQEVTPERPKRLTLSQIVELLLSRGSADRSTVSVARNARGETQFEVTVRTGEEGGVQTVEEAEQKALEVYARLEDRYPPRNGHDNGSIEVTRNAKGETQISVEMKTGENGVTTLEDAAYKALGTYDRTRMRYPMPGDAPVKLDSGAS